MAMGERLMPNDNKFYLKPKLFCLSNKVKQLKLDYCYDRPSEYFFLVAVSTAKQRLQLNTLQSTISMTL
jgi:hypothetical protein